jgi:WD40 repeat protein
MLNKHSMQLGSAARTSSIHIVHIRGKKYEIRPLSDGILSFGFDEGGHCSIQSRVHTNEVRCITAYQVSDDQAVIVSVGRDRTLRRWDVVTGQPIGVPLAGHIAMVSCVTAYQTPEGQAVIVSGSYDKTLRRWDGATGEPIDEPLKGHVKGVSCVTAYQTPEGQAVIVSGSYDRTLRRWDGAAGVSIGEPLSLPEGPVGFHYLQSSQQLIVQLECGNRVIIELGTRLPSLKQLAGRAIFNHQLDDSSPGTLDAQSRSYVRQHFFWG